jgi:hypothetical protein
MGPRASQGNEFSRHPGGKMLTLEDCIGLCGLTEDEVLAIAEHEHIPEIAAAEMGNYLVSRPDGELFIKAMIKDDMAAALARGDPDHALALKLVMRNFIVDHPRCEDRHRNELLNLERRAG